MICQNCNKNQATVRYTQIINGVKNEMHLCEKCSQKLGISTYNFNMPIEFSNFFSDFMNDYTNEPIVNNHILKCDKCNMTYEEFLNLGKFGCSNCYNVFSKKIDNVLKKIHGANRYLGNKKTDTKNKKMNFNTNIDKKKNEIDVLKKNLKIAIEEERYEDAAKIRDDIKNLEKGD